MSASISEYDFLSEIINQVNNVYGITLTEEDRLDLSRLTKRLVQNDEIDKYMGGNNSEDNKKNFFREQFDGMMVDYINEKYSDTSAIHHYEIEQSSGDTTVKINIGTDNTDYPSATAITNYEFEEQEQNNRRSIRLLDPKFTEDFVAEFKELMKESTI